MLGVGNTEAGHTLNDGTLLDLAMIRYNADGTVDASFGNNGRVSTDFGYPGGGTDSAMAGVIVLPDGSILLGGLSQNGPDTQRNRGFSVAKYDSSGNLIASFGNNGRQLIALGLDVAEGRGMCVDSLGRIVLVGEANTIPGAYYNSYAIVRLTANGQPDASFGSGGTVIYPFGGLDTYACAVKALPDTSLVVGGAIGDTSGTNYAKLSVLFLNPDGSRNTSLGTAGVLSIDTGVATLEGLAQSMALGPDGSIYLTGNYNWAPMSIVVVKIH